MTDDSQKILDLGEQAYSAREAFDGHLADACFRSLASRPGKKILVDRAVGRKEVTASKLLAVSIALSRVWSGGISGKRVGLVFPPGLGGWITNLSLVLCGKIPVNLNFTAGRSSIESSMRQAGIETIITAAAVKEKLAEFPWLEDTRDLLWEIKSLSKVGIVAMIAAIWIFPKGILSRLLGIPKSGGNGEAALLFSSGSTAEPKGVVLTHRNIMGNCQQIADCQLLPEKETLLACLPIFHSFGFTVTLWYPLLSGLRVVTLPSPLDATRIAAAVHVEQATVMFGTPTFFRPYFKRVKPKILRNLKYVVAGAEKTPEGFKEKWEDHFDGLYLEGYGLTETSPVVSCNLHVNFLNERTGREERARRDGSVGRLFPGMAARIVSPETGEEQALTEVGMLQLKGPNIFSGYLNNPELTEASFRDGWFVTGDLARIDEDGFLFIEGRLSRFSKIGGEMVPHETIEQHVARAFDLEGSDQVMVAVTGVADASRGERLILLSAFEISMDTLRRRLKDSGLPNLWIPRQIMRVDEIPCLASGKLDLKAVKRMAEKSL